MSGVSRLFHRDFSLWFVARSVSAAGTAATTVALPLLVYRTSGSPALTAAVVGLEAVPYLLFGLFAGAAADRLDRRRMLITADVACALLLAAVPLLALLSEPASWQILLVAFGVGCGFCWFDAAAWGSLVRLVGRGQLARATSFILSTELILGIAVPAAAGLLIVFLHPTTVLAVDAVSYLVSAVLLTRIRTDLNPPPVPARRLGAEIADGLRHLWHTPVLRTLTAAGFGLNLAGGGMLGLLVVHADQALGLGSAGPGVGLLYAAAAVGSLVAAVLLPAAGRRFGQGAVSIAGLAAFVAAVAGLAGASSFAVALGAWAVWATARLTVNANGITVRQMLTPDHLQGRVNTTGRMLAWGGTPVGALIGGFFADTYGVRAAYVLLAVPVVAALALVLASPVRGLRLATD